MRIDDISSQTREETKSLYEKIFAMTNELKSMNRRHDEDREEFRTFMKEYEVNHKERKGSDYTSFREDIRSLFRRARKQSNTTPRTSFPKQLFLDPSYQRNAIVQREITNCPDTPLLENDMLTDPRTITNPPRRSVCCTNIRWI